MTINLSYSGEVVTSSNQKNNTNTKVEFEIVKKGSVLSIKDEYGQTLYKERIKVNGSFSQTFDLSNLPDAKYHFELNDEHEIKIMPFMVSGSVAMFITNEESVISKPIIRVEENYIHITNNRPDNQNMNVKVYYEGSDLAFEESLKDIKMMNRTYDFSSSLRGSYTIVLETGGKTFVDYIKIP